MSKPLRQYDPGQGITFSVTFEVNDQLVDAATLTLLVHSPDGTTYTVTPFIIHDAVGTYHADWSIPFPGAPRGGIVSYVWAYRWQATGSQANQNAVFPGRF